MRVSSSFSAPWPDPNSDVLSRVNLGDSVPDLLLWLRIRDTLLGCNYAKQDIPSALKLARDCKHPDAIWLASIFDGKDVSTKGEVEKVFLSLECDARAICCAWYLGDHNDDITPLYRSAELGNSFACSTLCCQVSAENEEEGFRLAQLAAVQRERDGFYWLGECFRFGTGCERDLTLAKENFLVAAELGHVCAAQSYAYLLGVSDHLCWLWLTRVAWLGLNHSFLGSLTLPVQEFVSGIGNARIVFLIGRALKGNFNEEKKEFFGRYLFEFDSLIIPAHQAVSLYDSQMKSARLAVDAWILVGIRLKIVKDLRILIGKMIWDARFEANYKRECLTVCKSHIE